VKLKGHHQYFLTENSQIKVGKGDDGYVTFNATRPGTASDNPKNPLELSIEQKDKAVTIKYTDVHMFDVEFGAAGENHQHRWFNFVLRPSLLCARTVGPGPTPVVTGGPTATTTTVEPPTTTTEERKCLFVIPIINFCIPKFW